MVSCISRTRIFGPKLKQKDAAYTRVVTVSIFNLIINCQLNFLIQADFMKNVHQTEDPHLMITSEIDLLTLRTILHMTLLLTLPTPKREGIQVRHHEWRKNQRLFLLKVF